MLFTQTQIEDDLTRFEVHLLSEDTPSQEAFTKRIRETLTEDVYQIPSWMNGTSTNPYLIELFATLAESSMWNYTVVEDNPVFNESFKVERAPLAQESFWGPHLEQSLALFLRFMDWEPRNTTHLCRDMQLFSEVLEITVEETTLLCITELHASNIVDRASASAWVNYRLACIDGDITPVPVNLLEFLKISNELSLYVPIQEDENLLAAGFASRGVTSQEVYAWMMTHEGKNILRNMKSGAFLKDHDFDMYRASHTLTSVPYEVLNELYGDVFSY